MNVCDVNPKLTSIAIGEFCDWNYCQDLLLPWVNVDSCKYEYKLIDYSNESVYIDTKVACHAQIPELDTFEVDSVIRKTVAHGLGQRLCKMDLLCNEKQSTPFNVKSRAVASIIRAWRNHRECRVLSEAFDPVNYENVYEVPTAEAANIDPAGPLIENIRKMLCDKPCFTPNVAYMGCETFLALSKHKDVLGGTDLRGFASEEQVAMALGVSKVHVCDFMHNESGFNMPPTLSGALGTSILFAYQPFSNGQSLDDLPSFGWTAYLPLQGFGNERVLVREIEIADSGIIGGVKIAVTAAMDEHILRDEKGFIKYGCLVTDVVAPPKGPVKVPVGESESKVSKQILG